MTENNSFSQAKKPVIIIGVALVAILVATASGLTQRIRAWYSTATVTGQVQSYLLDTDGKVNGLLLKDGKQIAIQSEAPLPAAIKPGDTIKVEGEMGAVTDYGQHVRAFTVANTATGATVQAIEPKPMNESPTSTPRESKLGSPDKPRDAATPAGEQAVGASPAASPKASDPTNSATAPSAGGPAESQSAATAPATSTAPEASAAKPMTASGKITALLVGPRGEVTGCILANAQLHFTPRMGETLIARGARVGMEVMATGRGSQGEFGTFIEVDQLSLEGKPLTQ